MDEKQMLEWATGVEKKETLTEEWEPDAKSALKHGDNAKTVLNKTSAGVVKVIQLVKRGDHAAAGKQIFSLLGNMDKIRYELDSIASDIGEFKW